MKAKKILIMQHYSPNKGNASLLYALHESLKKEMINVHIEVSSYNPKETEKLFGYKTFEWPVVIRNLSEGHIIRRLGHAIIELHSILHYLLLAFLLRIGVMQPRQLQRKFLVLKKIAGADLLISPGGHLFTNLNKFPNVFAHFFPFLLAHILNKKYVVIGQTIGPFFGIFKYPSEMMCRFLLRHSSYVSIRDINSVNILSYLGINKYILGREIVFNYPHVHNIIRKGKTNSIIRIGFTIHHLYYKQWYTEANYISVISKICEKLLSEVKNAEVVFVPMEDARRKGGDTTLIKKIIASSYSTKKIHIAELPFDPRNTIDYISKLDCLIATKTHSVIYGLITEVPTFAIAYHKKTIDFMTIFGLGEYCCHLSQLESMDIVQSVREMLGDRRSIQEKIRPSLKAIQADIKRELRDIGSLISC